MSFSSFLLEERCRFLSNFSQATAEVELPGEFLMPKTTIVSESYDLCFSFVFLLLFPNASF